MKKAFENKTREAWMMWLKAFKNHRFELSKEECLALRYAIITFACVAEEFFYHTLEPMCKGFVNKIYETYHEVVDIRDIATCIYLAMYDEGKWGRLNAYRGDCSLFSWIATCATQAVFAEYSLIFNPQTELSAKQTSLTLKSMRHNDEVKMVLDLVEVPQLHELLTHIYIDRMNDEDIMSLMGMSEVLYKKTVKVAETMLKETLISKEFIMVEHADGKLANLVSLALGDVSGNLDTTSSDEALTIAINKFNEMGVYEEIQDVLQLKYPNMEPHAMWDKFVKDQALVCGMTEDQLDVWIARYIDHESPVSVAERLGMRRSNVDNLFSRANKILEDHIRNWWKNNS